MLDLAALQNFVERLPLRPRFVTVSGAHLYGFASPDSDVDLRGCHQSALADVVGLELRDETCELETLDGTLEIEFVSHELRKYLRLLLKNNGYILEQIFSPIVVLGGEFLEELRPLAQRCITRHHYHHYRGFAGTQRSRLAGEQPKRVKTLLYAYRVLMTGIHLLRTGQVEANITRLNEHFRLTFIDELIAAKVRERAPASDLDWPFHEAQLDALERQLDLAYANSTLPEDRDRDAVNRFLVAQRMGDLKEVAPSLKPRNGGRQ